MTIKRNNAIFKALGLYLLSTIALLFVFFFVVYDLQKKIIFYEESKRLYDVRGALSYALRHFNAQMLEDFSEDFDIKLAVFDRRGDMLFSNIAHLDPNTLKGTQEETSIIQGRMYLVSQYKYSKRRHANNLVMILEGNDLSEELFYFKMKYLFLILISLILMGIIALFLIKIYTHPLKQQLKWFDRFLKDSTHEINTPLSVIMMSVERFDRSHLSEKNIKKLDNIIIASKTLSHIYDDLIYLNFKETIPVQQTSFDLKELLKERLDYFASHIHQKHITTQTSLQAYHLHANRYKISKLIDNLLSNAIKYNHINGYIHIHLENASLSIKNSGVRIPAHEFQNVFKRYVRLNEDQGGLGIGLSIVKAICQEHHISITFKDHDQDTEILLDFTDVKA